MKHLCDQVAILFRVCHRLGRAMAVVMVCIAVVALQACSAGPPVSTLAGQQSVSTLVGQQSTTRAGDGARVIQKDERRIVGIIVPPRVRYESLHDEAPLDAAAFGGKSVEIVLRSESRSWLRNNNVSVQTVGIDGTEEEATNSVVHTIHQQAPKLSRGTIDASSREALRMLGGNETGSAVMINFVNVKVGTTGSWDSNSGAITAPNSRSVFRAALIDCATGEVLWRNEVLLREVPVTTNKRFAETMDLLYSNLPYKGKH